MMDGRDILISDFGTLDRLVTLQLPVFVFAQSDSLSTRQSCGGPARGEDSRGERRQINENQTGFSICRWVVLSRGHRGGNDHFAWRKGTHLSGVLDGHNRRNTVQHLVSEKINES